MNPSLETTTGLENTETPQVLDQGEAENVLGLLGPIEDTEVNDDPELEKLRNSLNNALTLLNDGELARINSWLFREKGNGERKLGGKISLNLGKQLYGTLTSQRKAFLKYYRETNALLNDKVKESYTGTAH